jgi:hypothetical protein
MGRDTDGMRGWFPGKAAFSDQRSGKRKGEPETVERKTLTTEDTETSE